MVGTGDPCPFAGLVLASLLPALMRWRGEILT